MTTKTIEREIDMKTDYHKKCMGCKEKCKQFSTTKIIKCPNFNSKVSESDSKALKDERGI